MDNHKLDNTSKDYKTDTTQLFSRVGKQQKEVESQSMPIKKPHFTIQEQLLKNSEKSELGTNPFHSLATIRKSIQNPWNKYVNNRQLQPR